MSRKKGSRARGTEHDAGKERRAMAEISEAEGERLRREAVEGMKRSRKMVGFLPEYLADEVRESGTHPFTFTSTLIIALAAFVGMVVAPLSAKAMGGSVGLTTIVCAPLLVGFALAYTRFFIDSKRGFEVGFYATFGVSATTILIACILLYYFGILL